MAEAMETRFDSISKAIGILQTHAPFTKHARKSQPKRLLIG